MDKSLRFIVEKVYALPGKGVVTTGKIESGSVAVGEEIRFLATDGQWANALVIGIEVSRQLVEEASAGQQASFLLEGVRKEQIALGTILLDVPPGPVRVGSPASPSASRPSPQPAVSIPSAPSSAEAIHPRSSLWRTIFYVGIGILIILAILYSQGKLGPISPIKKIANHQLWPGKKQQGSPLPLMNLGIRSPLVGKLAADRGKP
jgi:hypothetical protein